MTKQKAKYTNEELKNLLHQEVEIVIEDPEIDEGTFSFKGKILGYNIADQDPHEPIDFEFLSDHGSIKHFNFNVLMEIREI